MSRYYRPVPTPRKAGRKHLLLDEWQRLLKAAELSSIADHALLRLLYETGMRAGEPGKLRLDHAKRLHEGALWVPRGKGSSAGWFDLTPRTAGVVAQQIDQAHPDRSRRRLIDWVFPGRRHRGSTLGISRHTVYNRVRALCAEAAIPDYVSHPHAIRHGRCFHVLEAADEEGLPYELALQTVASIVGHKSAMTTIQYYAAQVGRGKRLADDVLRRAMEE